MKKLVIAAILLVSFASCHKKRCWKCSDIYWDDVNKIERYERVTDVCDQTPEEIRAHLDGMPISSPNQIGVKCDNYRKYFNR
jgi:hypothetical protein